MNSEIEFIHAMTEFYGKKLKKMRPDEVYEAYQKVRKAMTRINHGKCHSRMAIQSIVDRALWNRQERSVELAVPAEAEEAEAEDLAA